MRLYHQPPGKQKREQKSGSTMKDEARQDRQENSLSTKAKVKAGVKKKTGNRKHPPYGAKDT